jgi:AcrR family transcriptional regulator
MERLGREAGISKALIYNYFPNRNDLLRALLEREMEVLRERQVAQIGQATDLRDLILRTTRTYVAQVKARGALLQRLWAEPAVARQVAEQSVRKREEALRFMVHEVIKTYGLPRDVAISAVDMGMAMTEAAAQHLPKSRNDVDFATHVCVNLLIGGLEALAREHAARPAARPAARKSPARRGASRA